MRTRIVCASLALSTALCAQNIAVVPQIHANSEAASMLAFPGVSVPDRLQIVIAAAELQALTGRTIRGVLVRRDTSFREALAAATGQLVVRIGAAGSTPEDAQPSFSANLPAPTEVYRGSISAPASPPSSGIPSWQAPDAIRIDFTSGFAYSGGPLCIEFDCSSNAGIWWPVDAASDSVEGSVRSNGASCSPRQMTIETASVGQSGLVIGRTATFVLLGEPLVPAWMLIGLDTLSSPISLGPLGPPGCDLLVDSFTGIPAQLSAALLGEEIGGIANADLHMPAERGLLGARLVVQWAELTSVGIVTSNALECQLALTPPSSSVAAISARCSELPVVQAVAVPVLGFIWD